MRARLGEEFGPEFDRYPKALYISDHTTAGFLNQRLARRLDNDDEKLRKYIGVFHKLFPPRAGYEHDEMALRTELSEAQRESEPANADSHLTFISAGLQSAATYDQQRGDPVWFVDLDGVHQGGVRRRRTTVVGYGAEEVVDRVRVEVEAPRGMIDTRDLRRPEFGFVSQLQALIERHGVSFGRLDVCLAAEERDASLTVNEFEPLLMNRDVRAALKSPFRFAVDQGREVIADPRTLPGKVLKLPGKTLELTARALRLSREAPGEALALARRGRDLLSSPSGPARALDSATVESIHILNRVLAGMGVDEGVIARVIRRSLAVPLTRLHGLRRGISLPVIDPGGRGAGQIPWGTYQSPILLQWQAPPGATRQFDVKLVRFV